MIAIAKYLITILLIAVTLLLAKNTLSKINIISKENDDSFSLFNVKILNGLKIILTIFGTIFTVSVISIIFGTRLPLGFFVIPQTEYLGQYPYADKDSIGCQNGCWFKNTNNAMYGDLKTERNINTYSADTGNTYMRISGSKLVAIWYYPWESAVLSKNWEYEHHIQYSCDSNATYYYRIHATIADPL